MLNQFFKGINYFFKGLSFIFKPGIFPFVLLPLLINILLLTGLIYYSWQHFGLVVTYFETHWLLNQSSWLHWLIWPLSILLITLFGFFSFIVMANVLAEPFNSKLAEVVEQRLTGKTLPAWSWTQVIWSLWPKLLDFIRRMFYYLSRLVGIVILSLIPPVTLIAPLLWFSFGAWMLALEYTNYPMDNHHLTFRKMRQLLAHQRLMALGFGSAALLMMMIPLVNLLVMPVAVAGATCFWVGELNRFSPPLLLEE